MDPPSKFNLECLDYDIEYSPEGNLDSVTYEGIKTVMDCQKKCQEEKECKHWTHLYYLIKFDIFEQLIKTKTILLGQRLIHAS